MTKITVVSEPRLTTIGWSGALLFVAGPIVSAVGYANYISTVTANLAADVYLQKSPTSWALLAGFGALCTLVGFVMLFAGRAHRHDVTVTAAGDSSPAGGTARSSSRKSIMDD